MEVKDIYEFWEDNKGVTISILKLRYMNYLKDLYINKGVDTRELGRKVNLTTYNKMVDNFKARGYIYRGCKCACGGVVILDKRG